MSENQTPEELEEKADETPEEQPSEEQQAEEAIKPSGDKKGTLINALEVQYIDIPKKFALEKQAGGWIATISETAKVTLNFKTMRKIEFTVNPGDTIEKYEDNIIILQNVPEEEEEERGARSRYSSSRRASQTTTK